MWAAFWNAMPFARAFPCYLMWIPVCTVISLGFTMVKRWKKGLGSPVFPAANKWKDGIIGAVQTARSK